MFSAQQLRDKSQQEIVDDLCKELKDIPPRWHAIALTLRTQLAHEGPDKTWTNALISNSGAFNRDIHIAFEEKCLKVTDDPVSSRAMSQFAYQIDVGGGGGTTWKGTITKVLLPGVLFHQSTAFKDWFYDDLIPWNHYIPVDWDLSNIFAHYQWAQSHPGDCQDISARASIFAKHLLSEEHMRQTFDT